VLLGGGALGAAGMYLFGASKKDEEEDEAVEDDVPTAAAL
jgi:hypothetical protein